MGHWPGSSNEQNHLHPQDPFVQLGSSSAVVNSSFSYPSPNMLGDGFQYISHWNPAAIASNHHSSSPVVHSQSNHIIGSSTHGSLHLPLREDHSLHVSPSNSISENNMSDQTMGNMRGGFKRKYLMGPSILQRGDTGGYFCAGSSSAASYKTQNVCPQNPCWDPVSMPPAYNCHVGAETSLRNVRSRPSFDLTEHMMSPRRLENLPPHPYSWRHSTYGESQNLPLLERNHVQTSIAAHGRTTVADSSTINHGASQFLIGGYNRNSSCSRNLAISQSFAPTAAQVRGVSTSYPQRGNLPNMQQQQQQSLGEGLQFVAAENYPNRPPRPFTGPGWRNRDRSRYRSLGRDAINHDQPSHEASFTWRRQFDQHRELRLDVDSMSYEELLYLEERIGSVSTGLSDNQMSKCLKNTVYLTPTQVQMEDRCVICLEEYQDMSQLGTIKSCSHAYHVGCIKKWLSLKNICPICKAPAIPDAADEKGKMKATL